MPRTSPFDLSTLILAGLAPGLPWIDARNGRSMLWLVPPSLAFPVIAGWLVKLYAHE